MVKRLLLDHKKIFAFILAVVLCLLIPKYVHSPYRLDIIIIILINAILAMTFIMVLRTGLINLGIAAFWGIGAYVSAILVIKMGLSFWLSLPLAAVITGFIAFCLGYLLIGSGSTGFTFVLLSSVIGMLFSVTVGNISYVGGYNGIPNIPPPDPIKIPFLPVIEFASKIEYFYLAFALFIIVVLVLNLFYSSWIGRAWMAIGLNSSLAESVGINIFRYKLLAFVLSSMLAGLIGSFYGHYQSFVLPDTYNMWANVDIQIYAILGGLAFPIMGPVTGAAIMTISSEMMRMTSLVAPMLMGLFLILLILFLPGGVLSLREYRTVVEGWRVHKFKKIVSICLTARGKSRHDTSG